MRRLLVTLAAAGEHVLRLPESLEADRALEYLAGAAAPRPAEYAALDREWLETRDGHWVRRSAIVELQVVSEDGDERSSRA